MAKTNTTFYCQNCGTSFAKWQGQCNSCNSWNTIVEEIVQKETKKSWESNNSLNKIEFQNLLKLLILKPLKR